MSTRKNSLVIATVRIGFFPIVVIFPFRCLAEVIEGLSDLLSLFQFASQKVQSAMSFLEQLIAQIKEYGPLDLADVDVQSPEANVRVRLLLR
jgi:hypothetical protein